MANPKISCLCVTHNRVPFLRRAIDYFLRQTYNDAELVIVYAPDDVPTAKFIANIAHPRICFATTPQGIKLPLGEMRNWGVKFARGEFIATWDDDDYHGPERLRRQLNRIEESGKDACFLSRWIVYDSIENRSYVSHPRNCEGTMLCRKRVLPQYPSLNRAEDTTLMQALEEDNAIAALDAPELYVYVIHGKNTWDRWHFVERVIRNAAELPADENARISALISLQYFSETDRVYALPASQPE